MDDLHADAVPFPFGGIVGQIDHHIIERMRKHERAEYRRIGSCRLFGAARRPVEQRGVGRRNAVPDFLHRLDVEVKGIGERRLGKARRHACPQRPHRHFEERKAFAGGKPVEIIGKDERRIGARKRGEPVNNRTERQINRARYRPLWPQQRNRLCTVANIVAAHPVEHRIDATLDQGAHQSRFDRGQIQPPGQRRQRPAPVGVRRGFQIIADQPQLCIAAARVDQTVKKVSKGAQLT